MTSSPGFRSQRRAAISSADVPEVVRYVAGTPNFSFIHASSYNGVKLSQSTEANYTRRYIGLRRVKLEP